MILEELIGGAFAANMATAVPMPCAVILALFAYCVAVLLGVAL